MSNKITVTWLRSKMFFLYEIIELSYFPLSWPDRISIWYNFLYFHKLPFVLWGNIKYNKIFDQHLVIIVFSYTETVNEDWIIAKCICQKMYFNVILHQPSFLGNNHKGSEGFKKKIWNFPDLVGWWVWKSPFSRFKK